MSVTVSSSAMSLTISLHLESHVRASRYIISYSYANTDCFNSTNDVVVATSETMYTLSELQEGTEYSIAVTAILDDRNTEESVSATTMATG